MKTKDLILIILGTLLFISGVAYNSLNRGAPAVVDDGVLSKNEAKSIAQSLISKVIYVYEQPSKVFDVEEKSNEDGTKTSTLKNYNDIVKGIFSEKGIKQLESIDDYGHIIIDYSIHDAIAAGFQKIVFIIRHDIEADFRDRIGDRIEAICENVGVETVYAYQDKEMYVNEVMLSKNHLLPPDQYQIYR